MSFSFDIKGLIDPTNYPFFRLIINVPQSIIKNYSNISARLNDLHNNCFFNNINLDCQPNQDCPRLVFISPFKFPDEFKNQNELNELTVKYSTLENLNNMLLVINQNPTLIKSYLKIHQYPNFNEIYDVCTAQEERSKGYTSNLLYYYRASFGNKIGWVGVRLDNNFTSQEDANRAFQKFITRTNFKFRNKKIKDMVEKGIPVPQVEQDKTYRNLVKLFKLFEKYWKHLAELYINNGFTEILITDKTPSGSFGPGNWFLSLFMIPDYSIDNQGNVVIQRNEQGKWNLQKINNYNLMFKPNVQSFFNKIYSENIDEEVSGSMFVEEIEFDQQGNSFFSLRSQKDVFLGFEKDYHFSTVMDSTRFNWHLHPAEAYVHYNKPTGEPSAGDLQHQLANIKRLNFFEIVFSKEGFYFYKASPPIQTLFLTLSSTDKLNTFINYFNEVILQLNNQVLSLSGSISDRIQSYLQLVNNVIVQNVISPQQLTNFLSILSPSEQVLLNLIYQSNCKIFEVIYISEFNTINNQIRDAYVSQNNLYNFITLVSQILNQNYYEEFEEDKIINDILNDVKDDEKGYFRFEKIDDEILDEEQDLSQWKKVDNYQEKLIQSQSKNDMLSRIFSNRMKLYSTLKIDNFINYSPTDTFAPNTL